MGDIVTASGAKLYIGGASVTAAVDTLAEFQAISVWTELGMIENMGEIGDESSAVTGAAVGDGRVRKAKGARDAGQQQVVCFHDPLDAGQQAARAAEQTNDNYPFKLVIPDSPSGSYTDTVMYYRGLVMSQRLNVGTNDNIMRRTFNVGVNSAIIEDPAST